MPTFVTIEPDPFADSFRGAAISRSTGGGARPGAAEDQNPNLGSPVRRPVRGLQLKEDTYATIQVRTADGKNIPLVDAGGDPMDPDNIAIGYTHHYTNFLLQTVAEQRAEKMQVVQTFGEPFVFFFGEHPRVIACSGILLNTEDFNWRAEFWENYDRYLRGTRCVQTKTRVTLQWDDIVVEGYFIKADAQESATNPNHVNLDFQIFLTNYQNLSPIGVMDFPADANSAVNLEPDSLDTTGEGFGNLQSSTQQVRALNSGGLGVKNSLLDSIRSEINGFLTLDGRLTTFLEAAGRISSGRNVRVPVGFSGSSVFDQETQIALASVSVQDRQVLLSSSLSGQTFTIQASLARRYLPNIDSNGVSKFGLFSDNQDEYIARQPEPRTGLKIDPAKLNIFQKIDSNEVRDKIADVFESFGVSVEPPDEATLAAQKAAFGMFSVVAGTIANLSPGVASLRTTTNIIS
jgi:hypothetical protein